MLRITGRNDPVAGPREKPAGRAIASTAGEGEVFAGRVLLILCAYLFLDYTRPMDMAGVSAFGVPMLLSLILAVYWLRASAWGMLRDPLIVRSIVFALFAGIGLLNVVNHGAWFQACRNLIVYFLAVSLPAATFLATPERLRKLFGWFVICNALVALWCLLRSLGHADTDQFGPGGWMRDNNDVALVFDMALPYAWFLSQMPGATTARRLLYLGCALVLMATVVATGSRGGFLGLATVLLGIFLLSPNKLRNFVLTILLAGAVLSQAPASFWERMHTIDDPEESSANERLYSWGLAFEMFKDHPIIGVGVNNYPWRVSEYQLVDPNFNPRERILLAGRAAHSVYFTLLAETGITGTLAFLSIVIAIWGRMGDTLSRVRDNLADPEKQTVYLLGRANQLSLAAFLVSGTFLTILYFPPFWYLVGFVIALARAVETTAKSTAAGQPKHSFRR